MYIKIKSYEEIKKALDCEHDGLIGLVFDIKMKRFCGKIIKVCLYSKDWEWYKMIEKDKYANINWIFSSNWFDIIPEQLELEF